MSILDVNTIVKHYDGSDQSGGELAYFAGKQYGSGWLRTLGRFAFPIIKRVARVASNVAQDVLDDPNKNIVDSIRDNALNEVSSVINTPRAVDSSINTPRKRKAPNNISKVPAFSKRQRRK